MGYHVKIEELLDIQQSILSQVGEWRTQLEQVQKALSEVAQTRTVEGKMGESVRNYASEVHLQLVESLHKMLDEFVIRFTMYARGYYDIDNSNEAEIAQDLLEDQQEKLMREREEFDSLAEEVTKILRSVNDIVSIGKPDQRAIGESYETLVQQVITLNTEVGEYEEGHQRDGETVSAMLNSAQAIVEARAGKGASFPSEYQKGSIKSLEAYKKLKQLSTTSAQYIEDNYETYNTALKQYEMRWSEKYAEDRKEEGLETVMAGILSVLLGATLIVVTGGAAAPLLIVGGVAVGFYLYAVWTIQCRQRGRQPVSWLHRGRNHCGCEPNPRYIVCK